MLNSKDIRNVKFSKSVGGYKQEEVDILLDKVEADYELFERTIKELQTKVESAESEVENFKTSQNSIQNVLVSAQKLADQIVDEAKAKSDLIVKNAEANIELITAREKELTEAFERKAIERKATLQKELDTMVSNAESKRAAIEKATADSVTRQQILFDKFKLEVSAFKAEITRSYKEHLEILQKLPDEVPMNPKDMAEAVSAAIDRAPAPETFLEQPVKEEKIPVEIIDVFEENDDQPKTEQSEIIDVVSDSNDDKDLNSGFVISDVENIVSDED